MDSLQSPDRDLRVDLRGPDIGMAEYLLDVPDIGSVLVHQRGHRVSE